MQSWTQHGRHSLHQHCIYLRYSEPKTEATIWCKIRSKGIHRSLQSWSYLCYLGQSQVFSGPLPVFDQLRQHGLLLLCVWPGLLQEQIVYSPQTSLSSSLTVLDIPETRRPKMQDIADTGLWLAGQQWWRHCTWVALSGGLIGTQLQT